MRCVAFDKTGTLTRGTPEVVDVVALNGMPPATIVSLAASIEQRSEHPIARAIVAYAERPRRARASPASNVTALTGLGAEGRVSGTEVHPRQPPAVRGAAALFAGGARASRRGQRARADAGPPGARRRAGRHHCRRRSAARGRARRRRHPAPAGRAVGGDADRRQHGDGGARSRPSSASTTSGPS